MNRDDNEETRLGAIRGLWTASVCGLALWAILIGLAWLALSKY